MNESLPEGQHDYHFVGKVGLFCPMKPGKGGGILVREKKLDDGTVKYDSATGADGYRWMEAEMVRELGKEDDIDRSYYDDLVNAAIYGKGSGKNRKPGISDFGDFEMFVADDIEEGVAPWTKADCGDELPWTRPCGKENCYKCPNLTRDHAGFYCKLGHDISDLNPINDEDELFKKR